MHLPCIYLFNIVKDARDLPDFFLNHPLFISGVDDDISKESFPGNKIKVELNELDEEVDGMKETFNKECEKIKNGNNFEFEDAADVENAKAEGSNDEDDDEDTSPLFAKYNAIPTTPGGRPHEVPPSPLERIGRTLSTITESFSSPEKLANALRYSKRVRKQATQKVVSK